MEENKKQDERRGKKKRYSKAQQFAEQMEQLCGPNYRKEEVGALGEDVNKEGRKSRGRMSQDGGVEVKAQM